MGQYGQYGRCQSHKTAYGCCSNKIKFNHPKCRCKQIIRNSKSRQRSQSHKNNNHRTDNMRINRRLTDNQTADNPQSTPHRSRQPDACLPQQFKCQLHHNHLHRQRKRNTLPGSRKTQCKTQRQCLRMKACQCNIHSRQKNCKKCRRITQYPYEIRSIPTVIVVIRCLKKACKHSRQQKNHGGIVHNQHNTAL